jgi:hypothetical protein
MAGAAFLALYACLPGFAGAAVDAVEEKIIAVREARISVDFHYPRLGTDEVDADIEEWANRVVADFMADNGETAAGQTHEFEMSGSYRIVRASDAVLTVVWDIWYYTGGVHGQLDIVACVYDLRSGRLLDVSDLFADEQKALNLMSAFSYRRLSETLGTPNEDMIRSGTSPDLANFATLAPTPEGVRVFFQPYQVAPWVDGPQEVDMPLEDLRPAGPLPEYWGRSEAVEP